MFSEKKVAEFLNSNKSLMKHRDELPQPNPQGQISPIEPPTLRDFELVSIPSSKFTSELLPPFAELSELALFDSPEVEYISESGFLRSSEPFSSIVSTWGDQTSHNSPVTTLRDSSTTRLGSIGTAGLVDVFLVLCAQSVGKFISTLTNKNPPKIAPAMLKGKLLLNLDEAQILSGLSQTIIMNAINNHELPFQLIEKAYLVKSKDLERFVDNL